MFIKNWEIWELFHFAFYFFYSSLGLPSAKSLQNECFSFLLSRRKIEPVTTHKMASYLFDVNIIF